MEAVKITRSDEEPGFEFQRAWIGGTSAYLEPHALLGGVDCLIETKPTMLEWGVAYCSPMDWSPDWPLFVEIRKTLPDGTVNEVTLWDCTDRPQVVAAARRFLELQASGEARLGMAL
ncbi:MAG: hypothetical protein U1G08_17745 [Verrucomicrobiota bacterium]